jgi:hypothetical protein
MSLDPYPYTYFVSYAANGRFGNAEVFRESPLDFVAIEDLSNDLAARRGLPQGSVIVIGFQLLHGPGGVL